MMPTVAYYGLQLLLYPSFDPDDIVVDSSFNVYMAEDANNVITKVTAEGNYSIFAGKYANSSGFSLDDNLAT